jgi:hypothetical protein
MNTDFLSHFNWLAIAVASVAYFMLGALWYSFLFKNQWIRLTGVKMDDPNAKQGVGGIMVMTFIMEFLICFAIAMIVYRSMVTGGVLSGIKIGLMTGGLICLPVIMINNLYQGKSRTLSMIDGGYHVAGCVIAAVILCIWH